MGQQLEEVNFVITEQHSIHEDSGCNRLAYMEVLFQESSLTAAQKAVNNWFANVLVIVEDMYQKMKFCGRTVDFKRRIPICQRAVELFSFAI